MLWNKWHGNFFPFDFQRRNIWNFRGSAVTGLGEGGGKWCTLFKLITINHHITIVLKQTVHHLIKLLYCWFLTYRISAFINMEFSSWIINRENNQLLYTLCICVLSLFWVVVALKFSRAQTHDLQHESCDVEKTTFR